MPEQVTFLTPGGLEKVKKDLEYLCNVRRPQVIKQLQEALEQASAQATPLENPDYEAAKNEQAFIEGRIEEIEATLKLAQVIDAKNNAKGEVGVGSTVVVDVNGSELTYMLTGSDEASPATGKISNQSPLGQALMGKKSGDRVAVETPDGAREYLIVKVK